jgi:hypothetical protein
MIKFISTNCLPNLYIYLWPEKLQNYVTSFSEITPEIDWWLLILRNHSQWNIVQWSRRSWQSCIPVWNKNVYYVCLVLKRSQCTFKQKETILKQGNTLKSKSNIQQIKIRLGCFHLHPVPGLYTEPTGGLLTHGRIFSPSIILKYSPIKICSEDTENASTLQKKKDYFPWFGIQKHLKSLRPSSFALMGCWKSL